MSSHVEPFECHWQASRLGLWLYLAVAVLALLAVCLSSAPVVVRLLAILACAVLLAWQLPRQLLLSHPAALTGLRHDGQGWQLYSRAAGWQRVQLLPDSLALPALIILRFRRPGRWLAGSLWIPADAMDRSGHRRLRLRLKFSRRRWAAAE